MKQGQFLIAPRPGPGGNIGLRNRSHQQLWRCLIPLGFRPRARMRTGKKGFQRFGARYYFVDAYHPDWGVAVELLHEGELPTAGKRAFLERNCAAVYWLPQRDLAAQLRELVAKFETHFLRK